MDKKIIIANWKSNKNINDAENFITSFAQNINRINLENKQIIIAPSYQLLFSCKNFIEKYNLPISLSVQDVSPFGQGAFTGEVNSYQVKELADFVIIGHSERRELFNENDEILFKKVNEAKNNNLKVVYCLQNSSQKIPNGVDIVAYEPPSAIGSGKPDDPSHVESVFNEISNSFNGKILYGGSVDGDNVRDFIYINSCGGLLIGGASLEVDSFTQILLQW